MQVVELPKEDPEEALRLFADIAGAILLSAHPYDSAHEFTSHAWC